MTWFAVHETATGRLVSVATIVADPLPPGLAKKNLGENRPPDNDEWDETTTSFVPSPPKVLVDRFEDDLLMHVEFIQFQNIYNGLNPGQQKQVRDDLIMWIGEERFRNKAEPHIWRVKSNEGQL